MKSLLDKVKSCDGAFCNMVAEYAFAATVLTTMFYSIAQL
jgi:hypothetical protein